jgi:hypothetical protein
MYPSIINGGVHALLTLTSNPNEPELASLATRALAELASRILVRKDDISLFSLAHNMFKTELPEVLKLFDVWMLHPLTQVSYIFLF